MTIKELRTRLGELQALIFQAGDLITIETIRAEIKEVQKEIKSKEKNHN